MLMYWYNMRTRDIFNPKSRAIREIIDFRKSHIRCTATPFSEQAAVEQYPYIELIEFELTASPAIEQIAYIITQLGKDSGDSNFYKGVYKGKYTNHSYILPYYSEYHHANGQGWEEIQGTGIGVIDNLTNAIVGAQKIMQPAAGFLYPKAYSGPNENTFSFSFNLINTTSISDAIKNKLFLERFITQNLHAISDYTTITPPCLYEIYIPGIRWSPAAVVQGLQVVNKGMLNNWNNYLVPDSWEVTVTIRELICESSNLFDESVKGFRTGQQTKVFVFEEHGKTGTL